MKGRPPGTPKSDDPNKKKRKRSARQRDLCDVKIKITEYFPGAQLDLDNTSGLDVSLAGQRLWTIQRVNGNGGNGKGDGVAGPHKHTLERSDEIKKNSVQRYLANQGDVKKDKEKAKVSHVFDANSQEKEFLILELFRRLL
jgi:glutathione S-transferase